MATTSERVAALESKLTAAQAAITSLQSNITALKAADVTKGTRIAALEAAVAKLTAPVVIASGDYFAPMIEMTFLPDAEPGVSIVSSF